MNNILEYLEKTAEERSRHVAVDDGSISFTWTELLDLSRKIGSAFCKKTDKGKPIVLLMEKSAVTLAAMFGTVYAGCFYVVIDPTQPPERISEIFRVLSPELVVTNKENENLLEQAGYSGCKYFLKDAMHEEINMEKLVSIREKSRDTDLLYGIFTSGSTGVPKGVVVSHRAVMDFIPHFADTFGVTADDRIGNQAPFDFDVSVKDIYTSLYTGAKLIIIPKELFSTPPRLLDYLCEKRVTTLIWAVSALSLIASLKGLDYKVPCDVNKILFSGEVMPVKILRKWQAALPHAEYVNLYGPAEITCNCTYHRVTEMPQDGEKIPIGKAFAGREVFLIDEDGEKEEIAYPGIIGEICVSGESLSEGYYHNPEETKKRFVFREDGGGETKRCYKTGDLGYYGKDGELYFSGRRDFQIKHMGHRIELEEIEHAMEQINGVERCVCVVDEKRKKLAVFYQGTSDTVLCREQMKRKLPTYMIPHKMIKTTLIPLTKNGKTDREYFRRKLR